MSQNSGRLKGLYVSNLSNNDRIVTWVYIIDYQIVNYVVYIYKFQIDTESIKMLPQTFRQSLGV